MQMSIQLSYVPCKIIREITDDDLNEFELISE